MESRHHFDAIIVLKFSAHAPDALARIEQVLQRRVPQHHNYPGADRGDFTKQKRTTGRSFRKGWRAIGGRAAPVYIPNDHVFALHTDGFDDFGQQLPGATDEWSSLSVFVGAWRFA